MLSSAVLSRVRCARFQLKLVCQLDKQEHGLLCVSFCDLGKDFLLRHGGVLRPAPGPLVRFGSYLSGVNLCLELFGGLTLFVAFASWLSTSQPGFYLQPGWLRAVLRNNSEQG